MQVEQFVSMLGSAKIDHDCHEYMKDGKSYTEVMVYLSENPNGPYCQWVFNSKGDLLRMKFRKKAMV